MPCTVKDTRAAQSALHVSSWAAVVVCLLLGSAGPRICHAQRTQAYRPTLTGPTNELQRNFGRIGGWLGSVGTSSSSFRTPNPAALPSTGGDLSNPLRQRRDPRFYRRPGMGQSDMDLGYGLGAFQANPLIYPGRAYDPLAVSRAQPLRPVPVMGALSRAYSETTYAQQKMSDRLAIRSKVAPTDYLSWVPVDPAAAPTMGADVTVLTDPVLSAADPQSDLPKPTQTLEQLVSSHVSALRRSYMERGWSSVKAGDYLAALRAFSLAEKASIDEPEEQAYARIAMVYTAIAAGQFNQAINGLEWLVSGRVQGYPKAFNRIFEELGILTIGELYASTSPDKPGEAEAYRDNALKLGAIAAQPNGGKARALVAVVEWGRGRRTAAIAEAEKVDPAAVKLVGLARVLADAETDRPSSSRSAADSGLPAVAPGSRPSP